jgi:hypothetical protein
MVRKVKEAPQYFGYDISIASYCEHSERSPEEYGSWSESYTNTLSSKFATKGGHSVASTLDIPAGSTAYVVWVEWSTGDSFGWADRSATEVVGIFADEAAADHLSRAIREQNWSSKESYDIRTPDGQQFQSRFAPWAGYFDRLDSVHVDVVEVVDK